MSRLSLSEVTDVQLKDVRPLTMNVGGEDIALPDRFVFDMEPVNLNRTSSSSSTGMPMGQLKHAKSRDNYLSRESLDILYDSDLPGEFRLRMLFGQRNSGQDDLSNHRAKVYRESEVSRRSSNDSGIGSMTYSGLASMTSFGNNSMNKHTVPTHDEEERYQRMLGRLRKAENPEDSSQPPGKPTPNITAPKPPTLNTAHMIKEKDMWPLGSEGYSHATVIRRHPLSASAPSPRTKLERSSDSGYASGSSSVPADSYQQMGDSSCSSVGSSAKRKHSSNESGGSLSVIEEKPALESPSKKLNPAAAEFKSTLGPVLMPVLSHKRISRIPITNLFPAAPGGLMTGILCTPQEPLTGPRGSTGPRPIHDTAEGADAFSLSYISPNTVETAWPYALPGHTPAAMVPGTFPASMMTNDTNDTTQVSNRPHSSVQQGQDGIHNLDGYNTFPSPGLAMTNPASLSAHQSSTSGANAILPPPGFHRGNSAPTTLSETAFPLSLAIGNMADTSRAYNTLPCAANAKMFSPGTIMSSMVPPPPGIPPGFNLGTTACNPDTPAFYPPSSATLAPSLTFPPPVQPLFGPDGKLNRPNFPVTTKPRDHDPIKQQQYEAYLEWRKANEPGYHVSCKMRQANRVVRKYHQQQQQQGAGSTGQGNKTVQQSETPTSWKAIIEKAKAAVGAAAAAARAERKCAQDSVKEELRVKVRERSETEASSGDVFGEKVAIAARLPEKLPTAARKIERSSAAGKENSKN
ncbi:hypothetical protein B0H63DRAFT_528044 [Podospora didyma]|uniref:Uncharacterized protein n=1 Tax=Podospora didyma TaxID=330526 RepID=A0AAE0N4V1_9PEZI|nr:hypothetical protein B0H63DRAFT_528044 [Podospora didyma]